MGAVEVSDDNAVNELFCLQTFRDCVSLSLLLFPPDTPVVGLCYFWGENQVKLEQELGLRNLLY